MGKRIRLSWTNVMDAENKTATTETWQEKQRLKPDPTQAALDEWNAHGNGTGGDYARMACSIDAYDAAMIFAQQCDEPGCQKESSCGWPTEGGYRRTCFDHWQR